MKNLNELEKQILHYDSQYREGLSEITDKTFDSLVDRLKKEKPESELLKKGVLSKKVKRKQFILTKMAFVMLVILLCKKNQGLIGVTVRSN